MLQDNPIICEGSSQQTPRELNIEHMVETRNTRLAFTLSGLN